MKYLIIAVSAIAVSAGGAIAQTSPPASSGTMKMSQSECTSLWDQASGGGTTLSEAQARPYVTDFKAVNTDRDNSIDKTEFLAACDKGMVHSTSGSGASAGTSGSSANPKVTPNK